MAGDSNYERVKEVIECHDSKGNLTGYSRHPMLNQEI